MFVTGNFSCFVYCADYQFFVLKFSLPSYLLYTLGFILVNLLSPSFFCSRLLLGRNLVAGNLSSV